MNLEQPSMMIRKVKKQLGIDANEIGMYSYYDKKSDYYDVPLFARDDVQAKRRMKLDMIAREGNTIIGKFTSDFMLIKVGIYNLKTGEVRSINDIIVEGKELENEISNEA